ncbi:MAG: Ser-Thr-rich GPI-anchored membrane family protein [Patescibacteria group bacterium]|nr:Ser-Thr-rich GPI-anchored membrane family protein [Patescibacteria group bacterium]
MKNSKRFFMVAAFLTACFVFTGINAPTVKAVTLDELQAQIDALMAQITNLQQEKANLEQGQTWCHVFNVNLKYGDQNSEVQALETALKKQGFSVTEHSSNFMARFDEKMVTAVVEFQEKYRTDILAPYNISHGTGFVGPTTRAKLNELYGCKTGKEYIELFSPNGGEKLTVGETYTIRWNTVGIDKVDIGLKREGSGAEINNWIARQIPASQSSYSWVVPVGVFPGIEYNQGNFEIRIGESPFQPGSGAETISDESDNSFSIIRGSASCHTTDPWSWTYCSENCPCNAGEGDCDKDSHCITGYCAKDVGANYGQDASKDVCEVKATISTPVLVLSYPKSGKVGTSVTISGKNFTQLSTVSLNNNGIETEFVSSEKLTFTIPELYLDPGSYDLKVANVGDIETYYSNILDFEITSDSASCHTTDPWSWTYCSENCPCNAGEGDCDKDSHCITGYCAKDVGANYGQDASKDVCEVKTERSITVTKPIYNEQIQAGEIYTIRWTSVGSDNIDITFGKMGGANTDIVKDISASTGYYNWQVPADLDPCNDYVIRFFCGTYLKETASFNIVEATTPSIAVISPNGGEQWKVGETHDIKWTTNSKESTVGIILYDESISASASKVWQKENISNTGNYSFTVPNLITRNSYKIYISTKDAYDRSDDYFTITVAEETTCTDNDGYKNFYEKGKSYGEHQAGNGPEIKWWEDYCVNNNTVIDFTCRTNVYSDSDKIAVWSDSYTCPYGCSDGACIGRCPDINNDDIVNYLDLAILADSIDYCSGDNDYNDLADLTGDGCVDNADKEYLGRSDHWLKDRSSISVCLKLSDVWDIDDNGVLTPEIDGKIIQRYLFEIRGDALLGNGVGANAKRDYSEIITYLDYLKNAGALDVDNNGQSDGGSDSLIIYRYMAGFTGSALIKEAVALNATRTSASAIQTFLECENDSCLTSSVGSLGLSGMEKQLASASDAISQIIENLKNLIGK